MRLFRSTGVAELRLVRDLDWRAWPPRLPEQSIFCPVMTFAYAERIARDWSAVDDAWGFVTPSDVAGDMAARHPIQEAGGRAHSELWVLAKDLAAFDRAIVGRIDVVAAYRGGAPVPPAQALRQLDDA